MRIWFWQHVHDMAERLWHWTYYNKLQKRYEMPDKAPDGGTYATISGDECCFL